MATLSQVNVKITGDTSSLTASLSEASGKVTSFTTKLSSIGTTEARGFSNLARGFTNAAGQSGVLNSEISILASSVGNIGLVTAGAGIGIGALVGALGASIKSSIDFETAITRVAKTANFSASETKAFGDEILSMSRRLPVATSSLTDIAVVAGQLGIQGTHNIAAFVEEVAKLHSTTNVDASVLATGLGTLLQVFQQPVDNIGRISAAITELGNTSNSTETQILDISTRLAGVGAALHVPIADILGISSAVAAVTQDTEASGTALQRVFLDIDEAATNGGDKLTIFADVAGLTVDQFKELAKNDPGRALAAFVDGLGKVDNARAVLDALGESDVRTTRTLLSLANSATPVAASIDDARRAALEATATNDEFGRSSDTTAGKLQLLKNNVFATAVEIGDVFNPVVASALDALNGLFSVDASGGLDNLRNNFGALGETIAGVTDYTFGLKGAIDDLPGPHAVDLLAAAFDNLGSSVLEVAGEIPGIGVAIAAAQSVVSGLSFLTSNFASNIGFGGGDSSSSGSSGGTPLRGLDDLLGINKSIKDQTLHDNLQKKKQAERVTITIPDALQPGGGHKSGGGGGGSSGGGGGGSVGSNAAVGGLSAAEQAAQQGLVDMAAAFDQFHVATGQGVTDFLALIKVSEDKASLDQRQATAEIGLQTHMLEATDATFQLRDGLISIEEAAVRAGITLPQEIAKVFAAVTDSIRSAAQGLFSRPSREGAQLQKNIDELQLQADTLTAQGADASKVGAKGTKDNPAPPVSNRDTELKSAESSIKALQLQKKLLDDKATIQQDELTLADQTLQTEKEREFSTALYTIALNDASTQQKNANALVSLQQIAQQNYIDALLTGAQAIDNNSNLNFFNSLSGDDRNNLARLLAIQAGEVPSFDTGIARVPHDMLAQVHEGERIVPASQNLRGESGTSGGNIVNITNYITADSQASEAAMQQLAEMVNERLDFSLRRQGLAGAAVNTNTFTPPGVR